MILKTRSKGISSKPIDGKLADPALAVKRRVNEHPNKQEPRNRGQCRY